eukprot:5975687-Ditylum_brightwellii.AAC.1
MQTVNATLRDLERARKRESRRGAGSMWAFGLGPQRERAHGTKTVRWKGPRMVSHWDIGIQT